MTVDEIAIKLGISTAELKTRLPEATAMIKSFAEKGGEHVNAVGKLWDKLNDKVAGTRDLASAIATALGLNIQNIANNVAQLLTGISDKSAKAYERLGELSSDLTNKQIDAMRRLASLENQMTLVEQDRERAQRKLTEARAAEAAQLSLTDILLRNLRYPQLAIIDLVKRREEIEKSLTSQVEQTELLTRATLESDRLATEEKKKQEQIGAIVLEYAKNEENHTAAIYGTEAKIAALQHNLVEAKEALAKAEAGSVQQGKLLLEVQKARFALDDAQLKLKQQIAGSTGEELEYLRLIHKVSVGIATGPEELRLSQIKLIRKERGVELELVDLANKAIAQTLTPAEEKRLEVLTKQKTELDKALAIILRMMGLPATPAPPVQATLDAVYELNKEWDNFAGKISGGADFGSMSDAGLRGVIAKNLDLLNSVTASGTLLRNAGSSNNWGDIGTMNSANLAIQQARDILNQRAGIRSTVGALGTDAAVMQYGDSAVNRATSTSNSDSRNQTILLGGIAQTINRVFPGQATPIPPIR